MQYLAWIYRFLSDLEKSSSVESVTNEKKIQAKLRQLLLNEAWAWKHKSRNTLFEALSYRCLRLRYTAHSEEQLREERADIQKVGTKLHSKLPNSAWDFSHWRDTDFTHIY